MAPSGSGHTPPDGSRSRAISPVVGATLMFVIVIVLAGVTSGLVLGLMDGEEPSPNAVLTVHSDAADDELTLRHTNGDPLYADQTRIIWVLDGTRFESPPTDSHTKLTAGQSTTFTFDGSTSTTGRWTSYSSPGNASITDGDTVTVRVYDTASGKSVFENRVSVGATGDGTSEGVSVSVDEYCAGSSVGENEDETENENEDDGGDYAYEYDYDYDYEEGNYRYEYDYDYNWSASAVQDPDPSPDPDPDSGLACVDGDENPSPDPMPEPTPP